MDGCPCRVEECEGRRRTVTVSDEGGAGSGRVVGSAQAREKIDDFVAEALEVVEGLRCGHTGDGGPDPGCEVVYVDEGAEEGVE